MSCGNRACSHSPVFSSTTQRLGVAHAVGLLAGRHQPGEEQEGDHDDDQAAAEPEQEAERAVERADAAVEDHVGDAHGDDRDDQQRDQEHAADHRAGGDDVAGNVGFGDRQKLVVEQQRRHRRGAPGGDRQDLAHEAADHGEQAGNQHHAEQENVEPRNRAWIAQRCGRCARSSRDCELVGRIGIGLAPTLTCPDRARQGPADESAQWFNFVSFFGGSGTMAGHAMLVV